MFLFFCVINYSKYEYLLLKLCFVMFKSFLWYVLVDIIFVGLIVCEIKNNNGEVEK